MNLTVDFCAHDAPHAVGGPYVWIQRLPLELRELGIRVRVRILNWCGPSEDAVFRVLKRNGIEVSTTPATDTASNVRWLLSQTHGQPPDIFVPNLVVAGYYAGRYLKQSGIPTVGVLHSDDPFDVGIAESFVFSRTKYQVSSVVCVSEFIRQQILKKDPECVEVRRIPCGVPLPMTVANAPHKVLRIAYVGRFVEKQKRILELARAFARATREVKGVEAVLIGDGPARRQVEQIVASESGSAVHMAGVVDGNMVQKRLAECHVIVLLSDFEGMPMAVMEGMACGCVPVCLRISSGIPELIEDGVTGLLVDDREDGFVNAVRRLRFEPGLWDRLSKAARAKIESGYSNRTSAMKWAELFQFLHQKAKQKTPIRIPRAIRLPPTHPGIADEDRRLASPAFPLRLYRRSRMLAGKAKRQIISLRPSAALKKILGRFVGNLDHRDFLLVFNWHQVTPAFDLSFHHKYTWTSLVHFETEIDYLARQFRILPLAEAIQGLKTESLRGPCAALSFDDGDVSMAEHVVPALSRRKLPATFFINTAYLGCDRSYWFPILEYLLHYGPDSRSGLSAELRDMGRQLRSTTDPAFYNEVRNRIEQLAPAVPNLASRLVSPDWLSKLDGEQFAIGAHGHEHQRFSMMPAAWQRSDLKKNIALLSQYRAFRQIFAVPFGRPSDWTEETITIARENEVDIVLANGGINLGPAPCYQRIPGDSVALRPLITALVNGR